MHESNHAAIPHPDLVRTTCAEKVEWVFTKRENGSNEDSKLN